MNKGCHAESSGNVSDRETVWLAAGLGCSEGSRQWCLFLHPTHPAAWCPAAWWLPSLGAGKEDVAEVSKCSHHHWKYPVLVGRPVTALHTLTEKGRPWSSNKKCFVLLLGGCCSFISRGPSWLPWCMRKGIWGKSEAGENFALTDLFAFYSVLGLIYWCLAAATTP